MYSDGALQAAVVKQPTRMEMFQASQVFSHRDDAYATLRAGFNVKAYRTDGRTLALAPY